MYMYVGVGGGIFIWLLLLLLLIHGSIINEYICAMCVILIH